MCWVLDTSSSSSSIQIQPCVFFCFRYDCVATTFQHLPRVSSTPIVNSSTSNLNSNIYNKRHRRGARRKKDVTPWNTMKSEATAPDSESRPLTNKGRSTRMQPRTRVGVCPLKPSFFFFVGIENLLPRAYWPG